MNKQLIARLAIILTGSTFFTGCAPMISGAMNAALDENAVAEKTAQYFGVAHDNITISSFNKGALTTTYQAKNDGKLYNCTIYYGAVDCKQPSGQNDLNVVPGASARSASQVLATSEVQAAAIDPMTPVQAQAQLNKLGYSVGTPDGVFGKKTVEKLKLFQKSRGLVVTGKLDEATVSALR